MINKSFDIVIVGGGTSGVSAAYAAAKDGMSVALIERQKSLGGLAVHAEVGTICGIYKNSFDNHFEYNVGTYAREFTNELQHLSKAKPLRDNSGLKFLPYSPRVLAEHCEVLLAEQGVTVFLNTQLVQVANEVNKIKAVHCENKGGPFIIDCKAMVDTSGVSLVSKLLNLEVINTVLNQSASQIFTLSNVDFENESNLSLVLMTAIRKAVINGELKENQNRLYLVPGSMTNGEVSLKVTVPKEVGDDREELRSIALNAVHEIVDFLITKVGGFTSAKLKSIAPHVGVRIDDRPVGKSILTGDDVLNCSKTEDFIGYGNWPMEIWSQNRRVELRHLQENDHYGISAKNLISNQIENLFFAGRCISATDEAIASARVIGTCLQTGYASGKLASGSINVKKIQETVREIQKEQF
ncbi:MAG: FAD-dependent oxidoreductase [Crocinitomicaceae bacterium]|nr:FAD-dependent oxidoreductase [Crocinitomicaceae bacterium]